MKTVFILFCIFFFTSFLNAEIPQEGLKAEMQGRWSDAAVVYEKILLSDSTRVDLYLRLSDIYSKLKQAQKAQSAIKKALKIEPQNLNLLHKQALLANMSGDYQLGIESYQKIYTLTKEHQLLMQIARINAWSGHLDLAAQNFKEYLALYPEEKSVYAHYAQTEIWRGNYAGAEAVLDAYEKRFGQSEALQKIRANLYAKAGWPDASRALYTPLLEKNPDDYMLNYTKTLALYYDQSPKETQESLEKVEKIQPHSKDSMDLRKFVLTKYRSNIRGDGFYFKDADNIQHTTVSLYGSYFIKPQTSVFALGEVDYLQSEKSSIYKNINGADNISLMSGGVGIHHIYKKVEGELLLGYTKGDTHSTLLSRANMRIDINDKNTLFLDASHGFYMISPLCASLGIKRTHSGALLELRPNLLYTVLVQGEYDAFSDENKKWSALLAPRRAFVRSEKWSVDLGVKAWTSEFEKDLNNGYYDPQFFESYMATLHANYSFSKESALFIMAGAGAIKDDTMERYRPGANVDLLLTTGIYDNWQFQGKTGYINNQHETPGEYYDSYYFGISVIRRF